MPPTCCPLVSHLLHCRKPLLQVIIALAENRRHVPYRASKLTHVLKRCLGGTCRTLVVAHVWPSMEQADETLGTCRLAQQLSRVEKNAAMVNSVPRGETEVERLRR